MNNIGTSNSYKPNLSPPHSSRGAALITAVFLITALASLGVAMTRFTIIGSEESINEWYSAQALYTAESGVFWSAYQITNSVSGDSADTALLINSWFTTTTTLLTFPRNGGGTVDIWTIYSLGKTGNTAASPRVQRQITVQYIP
ncbi:MAG: hypothetical protein GQ470_02575 [Gammaproteobacteria bacterium]|nr:hypothetical protein [Gammaproteobacteria bacterium]